MYVFIFICRYTYIEIFRSYDVAVNILYCIIWCPVMSITGIYIWWSRMQEYLYFIPPLPVPLPLITFNHLTSVLIFWMNIIFICICIFFIVIISQIRPGDGFKLSRNAEARLAGAGNTQNTQALSEGQRVLALNTC